MLSVLCTKNDLPNQQNKKAMVFTQVETIHFSLYSKLSQNHALSKLTPMTHFRVTTSHYTGHVITHGSHFEIRF